jgi:hypothetical protein
MKRNLLCTLALLAAALPAYPQQLSFTPFHASGIYNLGEKTGWTVTGPPGESAAVYSYAIRKSNFDTIQSGTLDVKTGTATIEAAAPYRFRQLLGWQTEGSRRNSD